ncbi:MAG: ABC transporter substrate-binding protein [Gammaproteobacteria bacterium]|nr:ABC transporter substrate-binding protein [Gammaproteobacteria bacterium]
MNVNGKLRGLTKMFGLGCLCIAVTLADTYASDASSSAELAKPTVVSINLCADQLTLVLAEPVQILSLSHLSHEEGGSVYVDLAKRYPTNTGLVEQVLPLQPDIVIAGQYTSRYTLRMLEAVGLRVEILPIADSIESMLGNITNLSIWLGQSRKGEALVKKLRQRVEALSSESLSHRPRAAVYDPNGYTVGENSLRGEVLELAGWHNVASDVGITRYGQISLETLLILNPDATIESPYSPDTWSRAQALSLHPAIKSRGLDADVIQVPSAQTICGGPWTVDLIEQLRLKVLRE